jgi:undecaprenyl-phosphate alpha-N-acetylglucosaminyl 1-phosphatetransferase
MEVVVDLVVLCAVCLLISGVAIRLGLVVASHFGIADRPGGHKQHQTVTPFVGGFGVISVVVVAFALVEPYFPSFSLRPLQGILVGALALFLTGLADDIWHLGFKPRFVVQALVALSMVYVGGVELTSLGQILPGKGSIELGVLAVPFTIIATIGLINAVNMIDGIDGLSGSVSLISLALTAIVAHSAGDGACTVFVVALIGGVAGFLYYNLRYPGNGRARVFLGDNGSMLLGFLFAWLFIALSQGTPGTPGTQAAMTPVTALWLFALPLMDTVGVMLRRIWLGKSPFRPDRHHLHHLFVRAGFRVSDVVAFAAFSQVCLGLIGIAGLWLEVPESVMFALFLLCFAGYFLAIARPWRLVPRLRQVGCALKLPLADTRGIFVGYIQKEKCPELLNVICSGLAGGYDFKLELFQLARPPGDKRNVFCVVLVPICSSSDHLIGQIQGDMRGVRKRLAGEAGVEVRLFLQRSSANDRRVAYSLPGAISNQRRADRRGGHERSLIYSMERTQGRVYADPMAFAASVTPVCR